MKTYTVLAVFGSRGTTEGVGGESIHADNLYEAMEILEQKIPRLHEIYRRHPSGPATTFRISDYSVAQN